MLIKHKNFMAKINYISRTGCFYGEVINCNDLIIFQTENKEDLQPAFIVAVEQYLTYLDLLIAIDNENSLDYFKQEEQSVLA